VRIFPVIWDAGELWETALAPISPAGKPAAGPSVSVAWTTDGALLAARAGNRVVVWDTSEWEKPLRHLDGPGAAVTAVAAGTRIAAAFDDGSVRVWDAATGDEIGTLASRGAALYAVKFSPDGALLAAAGADGVVRVVPMR
jgi:WD40 repeat protein